MVSLVVFKIAGPSVPVWYNVLTIQKVQCISCGPCILRPRIQPEKSVFNLKVVKNDGYLC